MHLESSVQHCHTESLSSLYFYFPNPPAQRLAEIHAEDLEQAHKGGSHVPLAPELIELLLSPPA